MFLLPSLREAAHYSCVAVFHSCPVLRGPMYSRHRSRFIKHFLCQDVNYCAIDRARNKKLGYSYLKCALLQRAFFAFLAILVTVNSRQELSILFISCLYLLAEVFRPIFRHAYFWGRLFYCMSKLNANLESTFNTAMSLPS